jgi:ribosomal subunit interface protein
MNIKIKTTNININSETEDYLRKKLDSFSKMIDVSNPTLLIEVELAKTTSHHQSGDVFKAEVNMIIDGNQFRAVSEKNDLNSSIDEVKDEMLKALGSYKGKKQSLLKRSGAKLKDLLRRFYK